jgi:hypothetical protein
MNIPYVLSRVNTLQRELLQIAEHYRAYFSEENHASNEQSHHEAWRERVYEIRAELYALMDSSEAQKTAA